MTLPRRLLLPLFLLNELRGLWVMGQCLSPELVLTAVTFVLLMLPLLIWRRRLAERLRHVPRRRVPRPVFDALSA